MGKYIDMPKEKTPKENTEEKTLKENTKENTEEKTPKGFALWTPTKG